MIKVLIVEDSPVAQTFLEHILTSDPEISVLGIASNGLEALEFLAKHKPDVVTMDIHMPKMNGFEATRRIMETNPVPIIILSASWDPDDVEKTFQALGAGAVAVLEKPMGIAHPDFPSMAENIVQTVKAMSEVKMVRRWPKLRATQVKQPSEVFPVDNAGRPAEIGCVAIGASTGGPSVLKTILAGLPADFPVPILIVQHIAEGFLPGLLDWLGNSAQLRIKVPEQGELIKRGYVYFAPDYCHMGVDGNGRIVLSHAAAENGSRPSVSFLFRSVAYSFGQKAVGILLTGMGKDGAAELKVLKDQGATTIIQDKESSVVYGMPGEALKLGAATQVLVPEDIAVQLERLVSARSCTGGKSDE